MPLPSRAVLSFAPPRTLSVISQAAAENHVGLEFQDGGEGIQGDGLYPLPRRQWNGVEQGQKQELQRSDIRFEETLVDGPIPATVDRGGNRRVGYAGLKSGSCSLHLHFQY